MPKSLISFYQNSGDIHLHWRCNNEEGILGEILIPDITLLFRNKVSAYTNADKTGCYPFWSRKLNGTDIRNLKGFYVLDDLSHGNAVLFKLDKTMEEPELYLFTYLNSLTPLRLSFAEYIETAMETRGMFLWQQYATTKTHFQNGLAINDGFFENMERLFPDADLHQLSRELIPVSPTMKELKKGQLCGTL